MRPRLLAVLGQVKYIAWDVTVNGVAASLMTPRAVRRALLNLCGVSIVRATISPKVYFGSRLIEVGARSFINRDVFIDGSAAVRIGCNVDIGMRVVILTGSHSIGSMARRAGKRETRAVILEDGVWLGAGSIIMPGVTVAFGSIVAAGSVVTKDCAANGLYAGSPARRIRDLDIEGNA